MSYQKHDCSCLPVLAQKLLFWGLPDDVKNEIIGDLSEEFYHQVTGNLDHRQAIKWLWQQTVKTLAIFTLMRINQALRDVKLVPKMTLMLSIVLFSTTFLLITWLSHLDGLSGYSFDLGTMVISGELHQALAHSEFWQQALTNSAKVKNLNYLVQWPALLWAIFCVVLLVFFSKITWISPSSLTGLCAGLVFTPYLLGTIYLQHNQLSINQSGPIVALMVFSIMYLVLPATFISLHNKNTNRNTK